MVGRYTKAGKELHAITMETLEAIAVRCPHIDIEDAIFDLTAQLHRSLAPLLGSPEAIDNHFERWVRHASPLTKVALKNWPRMIERLRKGRTNG